MLVAQFMTSVEKTYTWSITLNFLCSVAGMSPYFQPFYQPNECGKALCVRPDVMELDELYEFPEYSRDPTMYLALRNLILALWNINCTVSLVWIMLLDFSWHPFHPFIFHWCFSHLVPHFPQNSFNCIYWVTTAIHICWLSTYYPRPMWRRHWTVYLIVNPLETTYPDALFIIVIDFNRANLRNILPK